MDLETLYQRRMEPDSRTLYDQTQLDYTYMEQLYEHSKKYPMDLSNYKKEIVSFREKCAVWVTQHEEAIYAQFARLLDALMELVQEQEHPNDPAKEYVKEEKEKID